MILLSIWMVTMALPTLQFAPGNWDVFKEAIARRPPFLESHDLLLELIGMSLGLVVTFFVGLAVLHLWKSRRKRKDDEFFFLRENHRVTWLGYTVMALLFLGMGGLMWSAWRYSTISRTEVVLEHRVEAPHGTEFQKPSASLPKPFVFCEPTVLRWLGYLSLVGLFALLALGARRFWRGQELPQETELAKISRSAARAVEDLKEGGALSDVVLRCYREMCEILSQKVKPSREMTAREFALQLQEKGVREQEVRRLTLLFEQVRYGRYATGPEEREEATEALRAIEAHYGKSTYED